MEYRQVWSRAAWASVNSGSQLTCQRRWVEPDPHSDDSLAAAELRVATSTPEGWSGAITQSAAASAVSCSMLSPVPVSCG